MVIPAIIYNNTTLITPAYLYQPMIYEVWKDINLDGIRNIYQVSTFGRVRRKDTLLLIKIDVHNNCSNEYRTVRLYTNDKKYKHFLVHRLVMLVFFPVQNPDIYDVNHINGVPYHNYIWNLEWCTRKDNMIHASTHNLLQTGENRYNSKLSNLQVHKICKLLECNTPYRDILTNIGLDITDNNLDLVSNIKRKIAWVDISSQYNIPKKNNNQKYSDDEIRIICEKIQDGFTIRQISELFNIKYNTKSYNNFYVMVSSIRRRKYFKNISKDYIW